MSILLTEEDRKATYLGDGAYVLDMGYAVQVFTTNGITKDNVVFLEDHMVDKLVEFRDSNRNNNGS